MIFFGNEHGGVVGPYTDWEIQPRLRARALGYTYRVSARDYRAAQILLARKLAREQRR